MKEQYNEEFYQEMKAAFSRRGQGQIIYLPYNPEKSLIAKEIEDMLYLEEKKAVPRCYL